MAKSDANQKHIQVFADWQELNGPHFMGVLSVESVRGKEVFSFTYDNTWLEHPSALVLDPELGLYTGPQHPRNEKTTFGVFTDSSPDRWGKVLMNRREALLARKEQRKTRQLMASDYLLGVSDSFRMGALRFKLSDGEHFLDDNNGIAAPPLTSLRTLEQASLHFEREDAKDLSEEAKWLRMLLAPGGSLGGARPKASIIDPDANLWIAKFPSINDEWDIGGWEAVANEMAKESGLNTAEGYARRFTQNHHTYLAKRFDRICDKRIHFSSAMTMLGYKDGDGAESSVSYLNLVEFIIRNGAQPNKDLPELWSRIVFNVCISNTDDHLRNHGFLLTPRGWALAPAYDVNPNPWGAGLHLNIDESSNELDLDLVMSVFPKFRLNKAEAEQIIKQIKTVTSLWRHTADKQGIKKSEFETMEPAFTKVN